VEVDDAASLTPLTTLALVIVLLPGDGTVLLLPLLLETVRLEVHVEGGFNVSDVVDGAVLLLPENASLSLDSMVDGSMRCQWSVVPCRVSIYHASVAVSCN